MRKRMKKSTKSRKIADKPRNKTYSVKITCGDCGMVRFVKPSDAHHVTRCKKHQAEHTKMLRRERMREYRAAAKKAVA